MSDPTLTQDDVGKDVVTAGGRTVGTVSGYTNGDAYVDPTAGRRIEVTGVLSFDTIDDEQGYPIRESAVEAVDDEEVQVTAEST